jgi:hypothetical protein
MGTGNTRSVSVDTTRCSHSTTVLKGSAMGSTLKIPTASPKFIHGFSSVFTIFPILHKSVLELRVHRMALTQCVNGSAPFLSLRV